MALLYIGAGTDASPLLLKQYKEFVFLDQCPDNSTGHMGFRYEGKKLVPVPYKNFYSNVRRRIRHLGMNILSTERSNNLWVFEIQRKGDTATLWYHVNRVFPKVPDKTLSDIQNCTALYISGWLPHIRVFDMAQQIRIIYSNGSECKALARKGVKKLGLPTTETPMKLRYFDLLQHGDVCPQ